MTQADHSETSTGGGGAPDLDRGASWRGGAPAGHRRVRRAVLSTGVALVAVLIAASLVSAGRDIARIDRLKSHGIMVTVTVNDCRGNLGGSGSNVVDYTCHGTYRLNGTTYHEVIGSLTSLRPAGATVRGVVDPSQHGYVALASSLGHSASPVRILLIPGLLGVGFIVVLVWSLRRVRRRL